jgi:hypothetical protein
VDGQGHDRGVSQRRGSVDGDTLTNKRVASSDCNVGHGGEEREAVSCEIAWSGRFRMNQQVGRDG